MDKKHVLAFIFLGFFTLAYYSFILPSLPESWRPADPQPKQTAGSGNTQTSSAGNTTTTATTNEQTTALSTSANTTNTTPTAVVKKAPAIPVLPKKTIQLDTELYSIVFSNEGGVIQSLALKKFHPTVDSEESLKIIEQEKLSAKNTLPNMKVEQRKEGSKHIITFSHGNFRKIYEIEDNSHEFKLSVSGGDGQQKDILNFHSLKPASMGMLMGDRMCGAVYSISGKDVHDEIFPTTTIEEEPLQVKVDSSKLNYLGFRNKYFTALIEPDIKNSEQIFSVEGDEETSNLILSASTAEPQRYTIYIGPVNDDFLDRDREKFMPMFNFFGFDFIIHGLLWLLGVFSSIPGVNMGFAIIFLTLAVRIVLFPLNLKAQTSMFMMSKIGPEMKKLQEKFKNDRQQLGMEQMKLFRENGVNPLAGCLPMLIQMPVFISLFTAIGDGFILRHEPFMLWIKDVSTADALHTFDFSIPIISTFVSNADGTTHFNFLVVLYVLTMYIQQSMMPKSTDPQQAQMQKSMKIVMFFFAFLLYNYSSGLMLYFVGSNILSMLESKYIKTKVLPAMEEKKKNAKKNKTKTA